MSDIPDSPEPMSAERWAELVHATGRKPVLIAPYQTTCTDEGVRVHDKAERKPAFVVSAMILTVTILAIVAVGAQPALIVLLVVGATIGVAKLWRGAQAKMHISWLDGEGMLRLSGAHVPGRQWVTERAGALKVHLGERGTCTIELAHRVYPGSVTVSRSEDADLLALPYEALRSLADSGVAGTGRPRAGLAGIVVPVSPLWDGKGPRQMNWLVFPPAGSFACPPRPVVWLERLLRLSPALLTAACLVLALARLEFRSPAMSVILSACVFLIGGTAQGIAFALAPDRKVYGSTWTGRLTVRAPGERVNVSLDRVVAVQLCSRSTLRQELNVVLDCPPGMRVNVTAGKSGERMQEKARQLAEALGVPLIDSAASGEFDVAAGPGGA